MLASARRLARMIRCDFAVDELPRWQALAHQFKCQQMRMLASACQQVEGGGHNGVWVGAGIGRFLVRQLAGQTGRRYLDFNALCHYSSLTVTPADCAPAVALAYLVNDAQVSNPMV